MPDDDHKYIHSNEYKIIYNSQRHGLVGFYDIESILEPRDEKIGDSSVRKQKHIACSYSYKFVSESDVPLRQSFKLYRGEDPIKDFMLSIKDLK